MGGRAVLRSSGIPTRPAPPRCPAPHPAARSDTATVRPLNLQVAGGHLVLQAVREQPPALPYAPYTSARIRTRGKFGVAPSAARRTIRIEARMLLPRGLGLW